MKVTSTVPSRSANYFPYKFGKRDAASIKNFLSIFFGDNMQVGNQINFIINHNLINPQPATLHLKQFCFLNFLSKYTNGNHIAQ